MINLAENGVTCDCGSQLAPADVRGSGEPTVCMTCARAYVVSVTLLPATWPTIVHLLDERPEDLAVFEWHRAGVAPEQRRTLAPTQRAAHFDSGTLLGLLVVLASLAVIARAVFS